MELQALTRAIPELSSWTHADKVRLFAWYVHTFREVEDFLPSHVRECYVELHLELPANLGSFISKMAERKPKEALKNRNGYRLERRIRDAFDARYGRRETAIAVDKLLTDLPSLVGNLGERAYLDEALICFRHGAFRGAIVMCWNLAFDHLCHYVLSKHLSDFNTQLPKSFPKADISVIAKRDDFALLKESQVLQVCASANIISGSLHKILKEKLDRRNVAAHPSGVAVSQLTAEDCIKDLIENVVLKLA